MKPNQHPKRTLQSNIPWLHISELRSDWGPWTTPLFVSPSCIEAAYEPLPTRHENNDQMVAKFLHGVLKAIQASPPKEDLGYEVEIGLFEFRNGEESTDILLGVRADESGDIYLAAADDWTDV